MNYNKQDDFFYLKSVLLIINWIKLLSTYVVLRQTYLGNFHLCIHACSSLAYSIREHTQAYVWQAEI